MQQDVLTLTCKPPSEVLNTLLKTIPDWTKTSQKCHLGQPKSNTGGGNSKK